MKLSMSLQGLPGTDPIYAPCCLFIEKAIVSKTSLSYKGQTPKLLIIRAVENAVQKKVVKQER